MPPRKPPPDALSKLIAQLQQQLASQGSARERRRAKLASAPTAGAGTEAFDAYLTQRIERALAPLRTLLPANDVSFIGVMLRERLATDPGLSRLVERLARAGITQQPAR